jgi:four helix bundle protein
MVQARSFRDLDVWSLSMDLVEDVYHFTNKLPATENYVLTQQIRRCAISIPSNIAEGSGRDSTKEFVQFVNISIGSVCELQTQLLLSGRLYPALNVESNHILEKLASISRMLHALKRSLQKKLS